jgi:hypothetical protein
MTTIKATVRAGRIEVDDPVDLPDGTVLTIPLPADLPYGLADSDDLDSPEAIQRWIRWYEALDPVELTTAERAAWEAARHE